MSKTLKYLPEGESFSDHHFTQAEAFRPTKAGTDYCEGGMAKRYAAGGRIKHRKPHPKPPSAPTHWGDDLEAPPPPAPTPEGDMGPTTTMAKGGHLAAAQRHALPKSDFVFPGKEAYPVDTKGRARSALSRGAANASPAQLSKIKAKVKSKYPGMEVHAKGGPVGKARGGALSMQQPMAAPTQMAAPMGAPAPAPAMGGGGNPISDMVNGPLAGIGAQMQPGSPLHKAVTKIGQDAAKKIVKHITGGKHGKGTHGGKRAPLPIRRAEGGAVTGYAEGGDVAQDKAMVSKGVHQHEGNMHAGKKPTALKLADGGPINRQPQDPRARVTRHGGTPGGEVPYGVQPSDESGNAPITTLRAGGSVRR